MYVCVHGYVWVVWVLSSYIHGNLESCHRLRRSWRALKLFYFFFFLLLAKANGTNLSAPDEQADRQTARQADSSVGGGAWQLRTKSNCCCPVNFLRNNFVLFILFCILRGQITQVWPKLASAACSCSCSFAICTYPYPIPHLFHLPYTS